jgi:hypothetical protein
MVPTNHADHSAIRTAAADLGRPQQFPQLWRLVSWQTMAIAKSTAGMMSRRGF